MLKKIIKHLILLIILVSGCTTTEIPRQYLPPPGKVGTSIYGSWTEVILKQPNSLSDNNEIKGELISYQNDTLFLLLMSGDLTKIKSNDIEEAKLYIYRNQAGTYAIVTVLLFIPSIIGVIAIGHPAFLIFGAPGLITGLIFTGIESSSKNNLLQYPIENSLDDFKIFSRFPQGIPASVDQNNLLKE